MQRIASKLLVIVVLLCGCKRPGATATETASGTSASVSSPAHERAASSTSLIGSDSASGPKPLPKMKEVGAPAPDILGTEAPGTGLPIGAQVPDFRVLDMNGSPTTLIDLRKRHGAILLVFYRGGWCPYCNFELHELSGAFEKFQAKNVTPIAVSVDTPSKGGETRDAHRIPFPVLSDADLSAHNAFRVIHIAGTDEVARMKSHNVDLEAYSGKDHHTFAIPGFFLIDSSGILRWAHVNADIRVRPSVAQLLAVIDEAKLSQK